MEYKSINENDFESYAAGMFSILSQNMLKISPGDTVSEEDFINWREYQRQHFCEKNFVVFEDSGSLVGYFQYSVSGETLIVEEIEILPEYQIRFCIIRGLLRFLRGAIPDGVKFVSAYISKNNPRSYAVAKKLGMSAVGENAAGTSLLYLGDLHKIIDRYMKTL